MEISCLCWLTLLWHNTLRIPICMLAACHIVSLFLVSITKNLIGMTLPIL